MRIEVTPGLELDARRALWMTGSRTLVLADLHLGYAWVQRQAGNLLPLGVAGATVGRLRSLVAEYEPDEVVLLGDIVHRAVALEGLCTELEELDRVAEATRLTFILGNHDRHLPALLENVRLKAEVAQQRRIGGHLLLHGDKALAAGEQPDAGGSLIIGHAHPAFHLHDGVTAGIKLPCFLRGPETLVLPAFTEWAAGVTSRPGEPAAPAVAGRRLTEAIIVMGERLLRKPFENER